MLLKKWFGLMASASLVGVVALVGNGCSSSSSSAGGGDDGGGSDVVIHHPDSAAGDDTGTGDDTGATVPDNGSTGKQCKTDADCTGAAGSTPEKCGNDYNATITGVKAQIWPTPVCIEAIPSAAGTGNCDPGVDGAVHFCDGPDAPTSPGICLPNTTPPQTGNGLCLPKCLNPIDGSASTGCIGKDACTPYTWEKDSTTGVVTGYGFCQGACEKDADCTDLGAGYICQVDIGFCTKATAQKTRTKTLGTGCTGGSATTSDSTTGACNCLANSTNNLGYCSSACLVGGNACPGGYICDALEPNPLDFGDAGTSTVKQNPRLPGSCVQPCTTVDAGVGADGGPQCPTNSTCQGGTVVGPDCLP
ncbi:MAG TPA: hypothetical protein VIF15_05840 [Polyangiaceae bacterium]